MPVVVKERLLDLLQDNQQNYYELFVFFLDPDISSFEKENKARDFLNKEIDRIYEKGIDFPATINMVKEWCQNDNKEKSDDKKDSKDESNQNKDKEGQKKEDDQDKKNQDQPGKEDQKEKEDQVED